VCGTKRALLSIAPCGQLGERTQARADTCGTLRIAGRNCLRQTVMEGGKHYKLITIALFGPNSIDKVLRLCHDEHIKSRLCSEGQVILRALFRRR